MWLDNLKELKKRSGMTSSQIAAITNLPERTVSRIFSGDTPNPYVDTLYRIVAALDGSLDDILADSKTVVGNKTMATLQADADRLASENTLLAAEISVLKDKLCALTSENDMLRMKLEHKEEIISLHNYYKAIMGSFAK